MMEVLAHGLDDVTVLHQARIRRAQDIAGLTTGLRVVDYTLPGTGPLGPQEVSEDDLFEVVAHVPDILRKCNGCGTCMDCRPRVGSQATQEEYAPLQMTGGPVTEALSVDMMVPNEYRIVPHDSGLTVVEHAGRIVRVMSEQEMPGYITVHGDNHGEHQLAGCGGNALQQRVMQDTSSNYEAVGISYDQLRGMGIDQVSKTELRDLVDRGVERALVEGYFAGEQIPERKTLAAYGAGATYETMDGPHYEVAALIELGEGTLATRWLAHRVKASNGKELQVHGVSLGANVEHTRLMADRYTYGNDWRGVLYRAAAQVLWTNKALLLARSPGLVVMTHQPSGD